MPALWIIIVFNWKNIESWIKIIIELVYFSLLPSRAKRTEAQMFLWFVWKIRENHSQNHSKMFFALFSINRCQPVLMFWCPKGVSARTLSQTCQRQCPKPKFQILDKTNCKFFCHIITIIRYYSKMYLIWYFSILLYLLYTLAHFVKCRKEANSSQCDYSIENLSWF